MDVSRSFAFVNAIAAAQTPAEIGGQLVRLAKGFGFSSVYGGLVPGGRTPRREIAPLTLVQHVPEDWACRYNDRGYLFRDPVFHRLQFDPQPFTWSDSYKVVDISREGRFTLLRPAVHLTAPRSIIDRRR